ncbi:MAG: LytR/AlgR family response regulator transcription factor [Pleomorphochaeta sp.]
MKIGICDDSLNDIKLISAAIKKYYSSKFPKITCELCVFTDAIEFLNNYNESNYDLLFIDIFLNDTNGFNIAQQINKEKNTPIILYSSSKDFAVEGYQINLFGYLLKPLSINKLYTFLDRFHEVNQTKTISFMKKGKEEIILTKNILFIESKGRQVYIHTNKNQKLVYYDSLDNVEKRLDDPKFLRTHKSYLVNMKKITKLNQRWFEVENGEHVIIKIKEYKKIVQQHHDFIIKENIDECF